MGITQHFGLGPNLDRRQTFPLQFCASTTSEKKIWEKRLQSFTQLRQLLAHRNVLEGGITAGKQVQDVPSLGLPTLWVV